MKGDWYVHAKYVDLLKQIEAAAFEPRTPLLSPFDSVTCHRSRTLALCFFNDTATTEIYTTVHTLSLHDALPIYAGGPRSSAGSARPGAPVRLHRSEEHTSELQSRTVISYAVFCLKKKKNECVPAEGVATTQLLITFDKAPII